MSDEEAAEPNKQVLEAVPVMGGFKAWLSRICRIGKKLCSIIIQAKFKIMFEKGVLLKSKLDGVIC